MARSEQHRKGVVMDWPIVEVVIGLSFLFFLLSVVASAVNEAIAGIFRACHAGFDGWQRRCKSSGRRRRTQEQP